MNDDDGADNDDENDNDDSDVQSDVLHRAAPCSTRTPGSVSRGPTWTACVTAPLASPRPRVTPRRGCTRRANCTGQPHSSGRYSPDVTNITRTTFISVTLETRRSGAMCLADWMGPPSITTPGDHPDN